MQTKYFIYARKSTDEKEKQVSSIPDQIDEALKIAKQRNFEIVDFISESKSAKEPGRKAFNEMLSRIEKGEAQGILCWKLNRLARNGIDGGKVIALLQTGVLQIIQTHSSAYTTNDNVLMLYVEFGMANQFVKDLRTDVKRGTRKKAERGWYPSRSLTSGYLHNKDKESPIEILSDNEQFNIVKDLWEMLLTGEYSVVDLKKIGDSRGLVKKRRKSKTSLSINSYYRMFSNPFYAGIFTWKDENDQPKVYQGKHEAMITQKQYEKAQKILNRKNISEKRHIDDSSLCTLFSCGECGCAITQNRVKRAYCLLCKCKFSIKNRSECPKCKANISKTEQFTILNKLYYRCTKKRASLTL